MRTLLNTLRDRDMGFLRIITEFWGFDPPSGSFSDSAKTLAQVMIDPDTLEEFITSLPNRAFDALHELARYGGRTPWSTWEREHGTVRVMGPGRRDREQPWRSPDSPNEMLWYRGLLGRAFVDTKKGPEEFAYIPQEILDWLQAQPSNDQAFNLDPIADPQHRMDAAATIIDDCTTIVAAYRRSPQSPDRRLDTTHPLFLSHLIHTNSLALCLSLLEANGILGLDFQEADLDAVREFLLSDRMLSLKALYETWKQSITWNDMDLLPNVRKGGSQWPNDPRLARNTLLRWLSQLEVGKWYSLSQLLREIYKVEAAFQRPGGNFHSWYLLDVDGIPLAGIEHWYTIEGALLRNIIIGPLRWFGVVQLGSDELRGPITTFSPTRLRKLMEDPQAKIPAIKEKEKGLVQADGQIIMPRLAPRAVRYQLARFLDWDKRVDQNYYYSLTIRAINEARDQGLSLDQVRAILIQSSETDLPPSVNQALQRFIAKDYQASITEQPLLSVSDPTLLQELLAHKATKHLIDQVLNETTAVVRKKAWIKLVRAAHRLGIMIDGPPS